MSFWPSPGFPPGSEGNARERLTWPWGLRTDSTGVAEGNKSARVR